MDQNSRKLNIGIGICSRPFHNYYVNMLFLAFETIMQDKRCLTSETHLRFNLNQQNLSTKGLQQKRHRLIDRPQH